MLGRGHAPDQRHTARRAQFRRYAARDGDAVEPLLVLRRKRHTDPGRIEELRGAGVPVVFDSIGRDTFALSLDCVRRMGLMVSYGNASGPVEPFAPALLVALRFVNGVFLGGEYGAGTPLATSVGPIAAPRKAPSVAGSRKTASSRFTT